MWNLSVSYALEKMVIVAASDFNIWYEAQIYDFFSLRYHFRRLFTFNQIINPKSGVLELLNTMAENSKKEFGFTRHQVTKQLKDKCRAYRKEVENAMQWESEVTVATDLLKSRRQAIIPFAEQLIAMQNVGELQAPLQAMLISMIHMSMNRWFRTKNRLHELVLYEFLTRYNTSETAKKR